MNKDAESRWKVGMSNIKLKMRAKGKWKQNRSPTGNPRVGRALDSPFHKFGHAYLAAYVRGNEGFVFVSGGGVEVHADSSVLSGVRDKLSIWATIAAMTAPSKTHRFSSPWVGR